MKNFLKKLIPLVDVIWSPLVYPAALLLKVIWRIGVERMPFCKKALLQVGVFPIRNHYYEPLFDGRLLKGNLNQNRSLSGIDWNGNEQMKLLESFSFNEELEKSLLVKTEGEEGSHFGNRNFESGDAEFLYNLIRFTKPARIFEVGSGHSTLVARKAIIRNCEDVPGHTCNHLCIEGCEDLSFRVRP